MIGIPGLYTIYSMQCLILPGHQDIQKSTTHHQLINTDLVPAACQPPLHCHIHSTPHTHTSQCHLAALSLSVGQSHSVCSVCQVPVVGCLLASGILGWGDQRPYKAIQLDGKPLLHDAQSCPGCGVLSYWGLQMVKEIW